MNENVQGVGGQETNVFLIRNTSVLHEVDAHALAMSHWGIRAGWELRLVASQVL